jgi:hypothetical protein
VGDSDEFPPVGPENLVRVAEDSLQVYSTLLRLEPSYGAVASDRKYISSISGLISRGCDFSNEINLSGSDSTDGNISSGNFSPLNLPVSEALGGQTRSSLSQSQRASSWRLWCRVYTHALLLESRIFPNLELYDKFLDYTPFGFADIWKGNYHGELVCIKALRREDSALMKEAKMV